MASTDTLLIPDPKEHRWVINIDEIFKDQLQIEVEPPSVSLFQVPETITPKKPEAYYEPQQIGLGPIHHFRPSPYKKMEQKKLAIMRKVVKDYDIKDYKLHVLEKLRKFVPLVRSCYDMFLQDDDDSLARIFAIDGLFLFNLFHTYNSQYLLFLKKKAKKFKLDIQQVERLYEKNKGNIMDDESDEEHEDETDDEYDDESDEELQEEINEEEIEEAKRKIEEVKRDEELNQLLLEKKIKVTVGNQFQWERLLNVPHQEPELPLGLKIRSVAQDILMVENQIPFIVLKEINETLHPSSGYNFSPSMFRRFCVLHSPLKLCSISRAPSRADHVLHYMYCSIINNVKQLSRGKRSPYLLGLGPAARVINLLSKLPKKETVQVYERTLSILESFSKSECLIVPSASKLGDKSGFQFHSLEDAEGIRDIRLHRSNIYLPRITLNDDSEVILRNLAAYETLTANSDSFQLNEYLGLMCGLVMTKDDAIYLKSRNVIAGDMDANEVVKLFTGMSSSIPTVKGKKKSRLQAEVIDKINKVYESGLRMKIYLVMKKLARWLLVVLRGIGSFVESSWKIVAFMVSIGTVFVLTAQAYCEVYGCDKKTVTLFPYASS